MDIYEMREYQEKERHESGVIPVPDSYYNELKESLTQETDLDKYSSKKYLVDYLIDVRLIKIVRLACNTTTALIKEDLENLTDDELELYNSLKKEITSFRNEVKP